MPTDSRVKFNDCVRLAKWWRDIQLGTGGGSIEEVRTTLIELLCAKAYDKFSVAQTYTETLATWFSWLAHVTGERVPVRFDDYNTVEPLNKAEQGNPLWQVIDPVNANNNVVHTNWGNIELSEFASWFEDARDSLGRLVAQEQAGKDGNVDEILSRLFGNPVISHGELS